MPYEWQDDTQNRTITVIARPHRSLPKRGFAWFILITWTMLMVPALAVIGTAALWVILPFLVLSVGLIWYFLDRSYKDGDLTETLVLSHELVTLTRVGPRKAVQDWQANPHWVDITMHRKDTPVENYLTLRGNGRTVEFGAFLTADEREALYDEMRNAFARANSWH